MRSLCSADAISWQPIPDQPTLAAIPLSFYKDLIDYLLESEVAPLLQGHNCDSSAPCSLLRKAMRICATYLSVCKQWNAMISTRLYGHEYRQLKACPWSPDDSRPSVVTGLTCSLNGRYRGCHAIETSTTKSVLNACDYGGPDGCRGKVEVVIKISYDRRKFQREKDVYECLATVKSCPPYVPHLYFGEPYRCSRFYGLVLSKLGPDLETLRRRRLDKRFTPRMILAVAIQTIDIYASFHSQGWLHCNAKPGNFAIGPDEPGQNCRIFMFDFECSQRSEPFPEFGRDSDVEWNYLFRSINLPLRMTLSRREDLEGLGYVFSYLERGSLPWQNISSTAKVWGEKACTPTSKLFEGMDAAYALYFNHVKALAWGELPPYEMFVQQFVGAWKKMGYLDSPQEIDWWSEFQLR